MSNATPSKVRIVVWALALAGLIPFVWCAWQMGASAQGRTLWATPLAVYGAIILSFLGGVWWGRELAGDPPRIGPLILSNLPAVIAWLTFLPGVSEAARFAVIGLAFVAVCAWDLRQDRSWYAGVRATATAGVVVCLALAAVFVG